MYGAKCKFSHDEELFKKHGFSNKPDQRVTHSERNGYEEQEPQEDEDDEIDDIVEAFNTNYDGEVLIPQTKPGEDYWSTIHGMVSTGGRARWLPWNSIISLKVETEWKDRKATKSQDPTARL